MCNPMLLLAAGTGLQAFSAYQAGQDAKSMAAVQAQIARDQAADAIDRGKVEEEAHRRKVAATLGNQQAALGANLVELGSGSASDILADTAMLGELDALTIRNNAEREAYGYESRARVSEYEGAQAARKGTFDAVGSLLSGAGSTMVASKWYTPSSAATNTMTTSQWQAFGYGA